jgi:hypothetical protein
MSPRCCQPATRGREVAKRPASRWRRGGEVAAWVVPGALLLAIPKCPVCVAAYVMVATGGSVSLSTAGCLRGLLLIVCLAMPVLVTISRLRIFSQRQSVTTDANVRLYPRWRMNRTAASVRE